jgi:hypothetical protein
MIPIRCLVSALALLATIPSWAQDRGILEPTAGFKPAFTLSESWTDAFVITRDPVDPLSSYPEVVTTLTTNISLTANVTGLDPQAVPADTPVSLSLGGLDLSHTLADDANYSVGKTSASIGLNSKTTLKLSWTASVLTVTLTATSKSNDLLFGLLPSVFAGGEANPKIRTTAQVLLSFGDFMGEGTCYIQGSATTSERYHEDTPYPLMSHKITGAMDVTAPTLVALPPPSPARSWMLMARPPFR